LINKTRKAMGRASFIFVFGFAVASFVACGDDAKPASKADAGDDDDDTDDMDDTDDGPDGSSSGDGGGVGGSSDGGMTGDGSVTEDGGDGQVVTSLPVFTTLRQVGRFGGDVRIDVEGKALNTSATSISIQLFTDMSEGVPLADLDGDGKPDVGAVEYPLSTPISTAGGKAFVILPGVMAAHPTTAGVEVKWVDNTGIGTNKGTADLVPQPVKQENELCDPAYLDDRCADGLGCKGTLPTICLQGEAPDFKLAGYFDDVLGPRILVVAQDPDDDVASYELHFLDGAGSPVNVIDNDGNSVPDSSTLEKTVTTIGQNGTVFFAVAISENAASLAAKVEVVLKDRGNRTSAPRVLTKVAAPERAKGQSCDVRMFDRCVSGSVCSAPAGATTGTCAVVDTARSNACKAALVLTPVMGKGFVRGTIAAPSLWDVPTGGCSVNDPTNRPEALVKFTLAAKANRVTLSTNHAYTSCDTTLYLLSSCTATPLLAWCNDDRASLPGEQHTERAALVLNSLPAGEYFVVVDSFPSMLTGTTFELSILVE
jgi:hypothetical protein